jgi:hypothetical protein
MARLWSTGFELNSVSNDVENHRHSGSPVVQTSVVRSGTYAAQMTSLGSTTKKGISFRIVGGAAGGPFFARIYINITTLPTASNTVFTFNSGNNPTTGIVATISLESDGTLKLWNGNNTTGSSVGSVSSALSLSTWYRVELQINAVPAAGSQVLRARLEGTEFAGSSTLTLVGTGQVFSVGANMNAEAQTTGNWYFDDIAINDSTGSFQTTYPGDGKVIILRPNASGDANTFATQTGGTAGAANNFTRVNEVTPDDATTFNGSNTLNEEDMMNVADSGIGASDTVNVVEVWGRFRNNTADATTALRFQIKKTSGGTTSQSSSIIPNTTTWSTNATTDPRFPPLRTYQDPDASNWTQSTLDTMQVGYKVQVGGTNRIDVTNTFAYVDYTPNAAPPVVPITFITYRPPWRS